MHHCPMDPLRPPAGPLNANRAIALGKYTIAPCQHPSSAAAERRDAGQRALVCFPERVWVYAEDPRGGLQEGVNGTVRCV